MLRTFTNTKKRAFKRKLGAVHLVLNGKLPFFKETKSFIEKRVFPSPPHCLFDLSQDFKRLAREKSLKVLIIEIGVLELNGAADFHELRSIIENFRKMSGKPVWMIFHNLSFYEYYLATVADKIYMLTASIMHANGFASTINFYKNFLQQHGIEAQVIQVTPFKSAGNFLAYDEMPDEQREMINWIMDSLFETITTAIAKGRNRSIDDVKKMVDRGPITEKKALEEGWIDGILTSGIEALVTENFKKVKITEYSSAIKSLTVPKKKKKIAIIRGEGSIVDGAGKNNPLPIPFIGGKSMGDVTMVQTIRSVIKNKKKYKAAVFFIDSPGGSAVASEAILQEMKKLSNVLPVYIYFHNIAGSGGYYIACLGRPIYSSPVTLTGSIGVVNFKFINKEFYEKQKIKQYDFKRGERADLASSRRKWDDDEYESLKELLMDIYQTFIEHVSESRNLEEKYVDSIGGGRVWTGQQGVEKKIVDEIKSFTDVMETLNEEFGTVSPHVIPSRVKHPAPPILNKTSLLAEIEDFSNKPLLIPYLDIRI